MKNRTARFALVALVGTLVFGALGFTDPHAEAPTDGDRAVAEAWDALGGAIGNALFARAFESRAAELGVDDGDAALESDKALRAAVGHVLFAYDYRSKERDRAPVETDALLVMR